MTARTLIALASLLTVSALGCERNLNMKAVEKSIKGGGEDQEWPVEVESIDCPDKVKIKEGDEFECSVEFENGAKLDIAVEQTDKTGSIKWNTKQKFAKKDVLDENLLKALVEKGIPVKSVDCDTKMATPGMKVDCEVKEATGRNTVLEVKLGKKGGIEWKPKKPKDKK